MARPDLHQSLRVAVWHILTVALLVLWGLVGCVRGGTTKPQRGGTAAVSLAGTSAPAPTTATLVQPENPAAISTQAVERTETRQEIAPVVETRITETRNPTGQTVIVREEFSVPVVLTHSVSEKTATAIGPSWKDTAREIAAKLESFKEVQWAGVGLLVFALACFHPAVRAVVGGGKIVPALAAVGGLVLIFGPSLVVGNEKFLLGGVLVVLLGAFLVVRLSHKEGQLDALKSSPQ